MAPKRGRKSETVVSPDPEAECSHQVTQSLEQKKMGRHSLAGIKKRSKQDNPERQGANRNKKTGMYTLDELYKKTFPNDKNDGLDLVSPMP
jgi:hypothetical protein